MAIPLKIRLSSIQPGKPQQNADVERHNLTVREEWLGQHIFDSIEEPQDTAAERLWRSNSGRPNMGLGGLTPHQKIKSAASIPLIGPVKRRGLRYMLSAAWKKPSGSGLIGGAGGVVHSSLCAEPVFLCFATVLRNSDFTSEIDCAAASKILIFDCLVR